MVIDFPSDGEVIDLPENKYIKDIIPTADGKLLLSIAEYKQGSARESAQGLRNECMLLWEEVYIRDDLNSDTQLAQSKEAMKRLLYSRYGSKYPSKLTATELKDFVDYLKAEKEADRTVDVKKIVLK